MGISNRAPGAAWIEIINRDRLSEFAVEFTAKPVLEALVASGPIMGVSPIWRFFRLTRTLYDSIAFTHETADEMQTALAWEGVFEARSVSGATILTRDAEGAIERIRIYHYPFEQLTAFSAAVRCALVPPICRSSGLARSAVPHPTTSLKIQPEETLHAYVR